MTFIRPIEEKDLDALTELMERSTIGITTLPKDKKILSQRIQLSLDSFKKKALVHDSEQYLFALEDSYLKTIIGVSGISAVAGGVDPLYYYRHEFQENVSDLAQVVKKIPILSPVSYVRGPSQVCSLYLHPDFRKHGIGRLLSTARFHFIAAFSERFTASIQAELRGVIENGKSPFWEHVGRHFFNVTLEEAFEFLKFGRKFIQEFLPKYPLYIPFLPQEAQNVLHKTHPHTQGAMNILLREGFEVTDEIDIFDAGPKVKVDKSNIRSIRESKMMQVVQVDDSLSEPQMLISNNRIDFRAMISPCKELSANTLALPSPAFVHLNVGLTDWVRIS